MKRITNKKHKQEPRVETALAAALASQTDLMDEVISAIESMVGIRDSRPDIENGTISYTPQTQDFSKIQELYKNPEARKIIDKFFQVGGLNKKDYGLA